MSGRIAHCILCLMGEDINMSEICHDYCTWKWNTVGLFKNSSHLSESALEQWLVHYWQMLTDQSMTDFCGVVPESNATQFALIL